MGDGVTGDGAVGDLAMFRSAMSADGSRNGALDADSLGKALDADATTDTGDNRTASRHPRIGVAVIVQRGPLVLLGLRRSSSHGDGVWQFPGGHLEWGESVTDCARREVREETGLEVRVAGQGPYTNDYFAGATPDADKHYVTLFVLAESDAGEPQRLEPHKCETWQWFAWDALPTPLFLPIIHLREGGFALPLR